MLYRKDRHGNELSQLGFGCMRFPRKGGGIDMEETEKEILLAIENGVNYFDTAYIYTGSEAALGEILQRTGMRDRVNIATKLPQYLIGSRAAIDRYFDEELSRLRTDHVDYYLMHMLTDIAAFRKLEKLGIREWIAAKKEAGQIRNIGFSFHGTTEMFLEILNAYDWDFCQIQYNYLDEHTQAGRRGLEAAYEKGIPVIIMEPLRGGKLISLLPSGAKEKIAAHPSGRSAAQWGFSWLWNQPGVTVVLSGMNSREMVEENCNTASSVEPGSLTDEDLAFIEEIKEEIQKTMRVGCTGCGYCMPCPQGVDIPGLFRCYNRMYAENKGAGRHEYFQTVGLRKAPAFAAQCIECGKCESHCPQQLPIRKLLKEADAQVRPFHYRVAMSVARAFMSSKEKSAK